MIVYEHNGKGIHPPVTFNKAPDSIAPSRDINAVVVIQKMGKSYLKDDSAGFERFQNLFEKNYLKGEVKYELISETYNPVDKYKSGESKVRHLDYFVSGL
ncbi:hypothetical protein C1752_01762 [Acaryochloris thomasi RCC1774]|uniref:Uncharacterized protein n=1 Tax=Acaryochloris thomasi RCC1774 TaxID=1764569 RepID=A0A2W1JRZ5_9CYAN|nr:hypothetical protein C1752_01762 [Acaryochloris thomasi RCC1774]